MEGLKSGQKQDHGDVPHVRPIRATDQGETVDQQPQVPEVTPTGAFAVDSISPPHEADDAFDNLQQPFVEDDTSPTRPVPGSQEPSPPEIVAHLAPEDESYVEARIAERLERGMRETLEERLRQPTENATNVATPVKEEENSLVCGLRRQTVWILIVLLLLAVGGIVGGVVYSLGNNNGTTETPQFDSLVQELKPWIAPTEDDLLPFNDTASPQSLALTWLEEDQITMSKGRAVSVVLQRYVLAVLFYSTLGSGWYNSFDFMSSADVCTWNNGTDPANGGRGVFCSKDDKTIDWVVLSENNLQSSTLPWEIFLLTDLNHLDLGTNQLNGTIPTRIAEMTKLEYFDLSNNPLSKLLPTTMPSSMTDLRLNLNGLTGTIPSNWGAEMPKLQYLNLASNILTGPLPNTMPSMLKKLTLTFNTFTGTIPPSWGTIFTELEYLDLGGNRLTGPLPPAMPPTMITMYLSSNTLTGTIPLSWGTDMPELKLLDLSVNSLTGPLPTIMPSTITDLYSSNNGLTGTIPSSWVSEMPNLQKLYLERNELTGPLPASMPSTMTVLALYDNALTGTIPSNWGADMPNLEVFQLNPNQLTGTIPSDLSQFAK
jgi:Leucine-rich repeat (LRR) protein